MKKTALILALLFCTVTAAFAQNQRIPVKNVAVIETQIDERSGAAKDINKAEVGVITNAIRRQAVNNLPRGRFNVMTAETVQSMGAAVLEDCAEENCVIALGSKIGADYIVRGIISKFARNLTVSVEMYETEYGMLVATADEVRTASLDELLEKTTVACAAMYKKFLETSSAPAAPAVATPAPQIASTPVTAPPISAVPAVATLAPRQAAREPVTAPPVPASPVPVMPTPTATAPAATVNIPVIEMISVQGGTFTMGCTKEQGRDCSDDERPSHRVTLSNFSIGKYPVTQAQWVAVMGSNPSHFKGNSKLPIENVSWSDIQTFITRLNSITGRNYRLPTEAEWEYAARGGVRSRGYKYAGSNNTNKVAWNNSNSTLKTQPVGGKVPNELGIYDMSGNVWEWVNDRYGNYTAGEKTNPSGFAMSSNRVIRGGSWNRDARNCRVSIRNHYTPIDGSISIGFRLASSP